MVPDPRASSRADQLRPLNRPRPITVRVEQGIPAMLVDGSRHDRVIQVQDSWRIDDEWWRAPISRHYYRLVLKSGRICTIYHDLIDSTWYEQAY